MRMTLPNLPPREQLEALLTRDLKPMLDARKINQFVAKPDIEVEEEDEIEVEEEGRDDG